MASSGTTDTEVKQKVKICLLSKRPIVKEAVLIATYPPYSPSSYDRPKPSSNSYEKCEILKHLAEKTTEPTTKKMMDSYILSSVKIGGTWLQIQRKGENKNPVDTSRPPVIPHSLYAVEIQDNGDVHLLFKENNKNGDDPYYYALDHDYPFMATLLQEEIAKNSITSTDSAKHTIIIPKNNFDKFKALYFSEYEQTQGKNPYTYFLQRFNKAGSKDLRKAHQKKVKLAAALLYADAIQRGQLYKFMQDCHLDILEACATGDLADCLEHVIDPKSRTFTLKNKTAQETTRTESKCLVM